MCRNLQSAAGAGVTEDFVGMWLQGSALEVPNPGKSRTAPLQRRSLVLSEAAETGHHLLEPSSEMIAYAASQDQAGESSSGKGANKRLHAELGPLREEVLDGAGMDGSSSDEPPTSGKGRTSADENNDHPHRSTRPRNKVARLD